MPLPEGDRNGSLTAIKLLRVELTWKGKKLRATQEFSALLCEESKQGKRNGEQQDQSKEEGGGKEGGAKRVESGGDPMRKHREERPLMGEPKGKRPSPQHSWGPPGPLAFSAQLVCT